MGVWKRNGHLCCGQSKRFLGQLASNAVTVPTTAPRLLYVLLHTVCEHAVVEALRHKPAGRGFDSRCCHWNSSLT